MPHGKPSFRKFHAVKRDNYLQLLREGCNRRTAALGVGVSYELVRLYQNQNPDFAAQEESAEQDAIGLVEDALFRAAVGGNVTALQVFLYNRNPARWRDMRHLNVTVHEDEIDREIEAELARVAGGSQAPDAGASPNGKDTAPAPGGRLAHPQ